MLNSLREWGERRLTRVFALETTQKHLEFRWVCTVTRSHIGPRQADRMRIDRCGGAFYTDMNMSMSVEEFEEDKKNHV